MSRRSFFFSFSFPEYIFLQYCRGIYLRRTPRRGILTTMNSSLSRSILSLRARGFDHDEIAEIVSYPVYNVKQCLDRAVAASADALRVDFIREEELLKLDELEAVFLPKAVNQEDERAANTVLKVMERRAMLTGMDKVIPQQVNVAFNLVTILADMHNAKPSVIEGTLA